jgi:hypothetical protein
MACCAWAGEGSSERRAIQDRSPLSAYPGLSAGLLGSVLIRTKALLAQFLKVIIFINRSGYKLKYIIVIVSGEL